MTRMITAELLILDEPTNGLDPAGMAEMRDFIRALAQGGRTVLLSSHLMGEVEQMSDRVGVIREGSLVAEGTVDELRGVPACACAPTRSRRRSTSSADCPESARSRPSTARSTSPRTPPRRPRSTARWSKPASPCRSSLRGAHPSKTSFWS